MAANFKIPFGNPCILMVLLYLKYHFKVIYLSNFLKSYFVYGMCKVKIRHNPTLCKTKLWKTYVTDSGENCRTHLPGLLEAKQASSELLPAKLKKE